MTALIKILRCVWKADAFSPAAFVVRAAVLTALFCISEILGFREYTSFLSGTSASLTLSWHTAAVLGLVHLLLYVGVILLVPCFLITAGLLAICGRFRKEPNRTTEPCEGAESVRTTRSVWSACAPRRSG